MKLITFAIPCYNSADYMDACIESLLPCGEDAEIIIVDDGSTKDDTPAKADEWAGRYPTIIKAIHQENGGHGEAVNTGLRNASGLYYKVVDSDDWLDHDALMQLMDLIRRLHAIEDEAVDLIIANYVYEHVEDGTQTPIRYEGILPKDRIFCWDEVGTFLPSQNLLMHSLIYRTQVLRDSKINLPKHTFYVDNIFAYVPLPSVKTLYYLDIDLYRYFIGREDQSVNEAVMVSRIEQQLAITRIMIDSVDLSQVESKPLVRYMISYLAMMMTICSIFTVLSDRPDKLELKAGIWNYLKQHDEKLYRRVRYGARGLGSNLPGPLGRRTSVGFYHIAQRLFKFN